MTHSAGIAEKNGKAAAEEKSTATTNTAPQEAVLQDEFVADAPKTTTANHNNSVPGAEDASFYDIHKPNDETAAATTTQGIGKILKIPFTPWCTSPINRHNIKPRFRDGLNVGLLGKRLKMVTN